MSERTTSTTGAPTVSTETVEHVVRARLSSSLGGRRGIVEGALPTVGFTLAYVLTHELRTALILSVSLAVVLLVLRIVARQPVQFVVNSLVGIGVAALFASRSGRAEDVFLPGIIYNAVYAVVMTLSVVLRWPVVGLMIGSVTGDVTAWRNDPAIVRLCSKLTWILAAPCAIRVAVQYPLYLAGQVGWLGASKIALGWPLQVASLSLMAYLLARGHTPMQVPAASPEAVAAAEAAAEADHVDTDERVQNG
ncbi:MAG: hypothetical protein QOE19_2340 [Actinomycetota bacterium]|nr:hypothetical protein [Actinomycetota bacterium]